MADLLSFGAKEWFKTAKLRSTWSCVARKEQTTGKINKQTTFGAVATKEQRDQHQRPQQTATTTTTLLYSFR